MLKKASILFFTLISLASNPGFAQKSNTYYLKNNGQEIKVKDSADYIRIIQEPDSANAYFRVLEFYPDNSRKFVGQVSAFEPKLVYEGATMLYNKNGKKSAQISYIKGIPFGTAYFFHANGRVEKVLDYNSEGTIKISKTDQLENFKVLSYFDSTGNEQVKDGSGYVIIPADDGMSREEGRFSQGLKDSTWKGTLPGNTGSYQEEYKNGELISGVQTTADGKQYSYTNLREDPEYLNGGNIAFYGFFQKTFRYPREALERGITGSLLINFIINEDGSISDIKSYPTLHYSINKEINRVLMTSGKWKPAKSRGVPLKEPYQLPLSLHLNGSPSVRPQTGITIEVRSVTRTRIN